MSTDTETGEKTETEPTPDSSTNTGSDRSLKIVASGPATFSRQVSPDDNAEIVATHEGVEVTIEREITTADEFVQVIEPVFKGHSETVSIKIVIDTLLDEHAMDGYVRDGEPDEWSLTIEGETQDWKDIALALEPEGNLHRKGGRYETVVYNLYSLADEGVTDDSAVLAALDLIETHDLDSSKSRFTDLLVDDT